MPRIRPADNPFSTRRLESLLSFRPDWSGLDPAVLAAQALDGRGPCVIAGRHGSGKSTLLDHLAALADARGLPTLRFFFNSSTHPEAAHTAIAALEAARPATILFIDGDIHIPTSHRRAILARARMFHRAILTRHRPGGLPVLARLDPGPGVLRQCIATLAPDLLPRIDPLIPALWSRHRGNIREILLACYDLAATGPPPAEGRHFGHITTM